MSLLFILAALSAFILGVAKAGVKGLGIIVVALMANAYDPKSSTGILLPLLLVGDILSVVYYRRHVEWKYLWKFLPSMVIGVLIAVVVGKNLDEKSFRIWMAIIILFSVVIMFWRDYKKNNQFPKNPLFATVMGMAAGFTTMIGNLAGAFSNMYFLATQLPKNQIIGTAAWLFLIINVLKVPFHVFSWGTINSWSLYQNLFLAPVVIIGFFVGLKMVKWFTEDGYRKLLLFATAIGAIFILI